MELFVEEVIKKPAVDVETTGLNLANMRAPKGAFWKNLWHRERDAPNAKLEAISHSG
jgi:hypothetical protein